MKKIVFNTYYKDAASSMFYLSGLSKSEQINFFDFKNYESYDLALFMTYSKDLEELKKAKQINQNLTIGLFDPRGIQVENYLQYVDFLVVDSIEMKDFFAKYDIPIFVYYEYADIPLYKKKHEKHEKIIIGYHGNKVHLTAMYPEITSALELLGEKYSIEFWAMYNIKHLGYWNIGIPKNVEVKHIQWSMENYDKYLSKVDIGLVPACMPVKKNTRKKSVVSKFFLDNEDDYIIKFKMPSNPGRMIIFAKLGIPVIGDFLPSNLQFIKDEENGLLAYSAGGWYKAIEKLIVSHKLRQKFADNMLETYKEFFDYDVQNNKFFTWLANFEKKEKKEIIKKKNHIEDLKFNNAFVYEKINKLMSHL